MNVNVNMNMNVNVNVVGRCCYAQISEPKFQKLLRTVDLNGNGTIEFDEFCWMVP